MPYTVRVSSPASWSRLLPSALLAALAACGGAKKVEFFDTSSSAVGDGGFPTNPAPTGSPTSAPSGSPEDDAAPPPTPDSPCSSSKDCQDGFVCEVPACRGDGTCVAQASAGDEPHCGCDGVTYAPGTSPKGAVRHVGACAKGEATACTSRSGCSGGAECNAPVKDFLGCGSAEGVCWRWPSSCPSAPATVRACNTAPTCTTVCAAASQGRPYYPGGC